MYSVFIYQVDSSTGWEIVGQLERVAEIWFRRSINGTEALRVIADRDEVNRLGIKHGYVILVYDNQANTAVASGVVSGSIRPMGRTFVEISCASLSRVLDRIFFPPKYALTGGLNDATNKERLISIWDWRRISADVSTGATEDNNKIISFTGKTGGAAYEYASYDANLLITRIVVEGEGDYSGVLQLKGSGSPPDAPPYSSTAQYRSPAIDFGTTVTWDRLRVSGSFVYASDNDTLTYAVHTTDTPSTDNPSYTSVSYLAFTDPQGLGEDLTGKTPSRYIFVYFTLVPESSEHTPVVNAVDIYARKSLSYFFTADTNWPSVNIAGANDILEVGGRSLLAVLREICDANGLEWRITPTGTIQIQTTPSNYFIGDVWGTNRSDDFMFIDGVNCNVLSIMEDDTDMVNYLIAVGDGGGDTSLVQIHQDMTSQSTYGIYQREVRFPAQTQGELNTMASTYLTLNKDPNGLYEVEFQLSNLNGGVYDLVPGDGVVVASDNVITLDGKRLHRYSRVVFDEVQWTPRGVKAKLTLSIRSKYTTPSLVQKMRNLAYWQRRALTHAAQGWVTTESITDSSEHVVVIPLDFQPDEDFINAEAVWIEVGGTRYHPLNSPVVARVTRVRAGDRKLLVYFSGGGSPSNPYSLTINWSASGTMGSNAGVV